VVNGDLTSVETSRAEILAAIGDSADVVLIRGPGGIGDELTLAGTRELLSGGRHHEIDVDRLAQARGDTVLLGGGDSFCRQNLGVTARVLAIAELRFERVIVLPSTFDAGDDRTRSTLAKTRAAVFAREPKSHRLISSLCDARLAHDCAFFFTYEPYRRLGSGALNAFRTDRAADRDWLLPQDNDDLDVTAGGLAGWLSVIAAHQLVRTDRASVTIAAALLGKDVEFGPSPESGLESLVEYALQEFPVRRFVPPPPTPRPAELGPRTRRPETLAALAEIKATAADAAVQSVSDRDRAGAPRVSAVIVTRDRPDLAVDAIHSLLAADVAVSVSVVDDNSDTRTRRTLGDALSGDPRVKLRSLAYVAGRSGARQLAANSCTSEFVLLLDDDAELLPGALAHLLRELGEHPEAGAVTATVVDTDGRIRHSGGWIHESHDVVDFSPVAYGERLEGDALPVSGACAWVGGTAVLVRRALLARVPLDPEMRFGVEDDDWSYRVEKYQPGGFRRSREAIVVAHGGLPTAEEGFAGLSTNVDALVAAARFHQVHGRLLGRTFDLAPALLSADGSRNLASARILMEVVSARGGDWVQAEWLSGGLAALLPLGSPQAQPDAVPPEPQAQPDAVLPEPQAQPDAVPPEPQAQPDAVPPEPQAQPDAVPPEPQAQPDAVPPEPQAQPDAVPPEPQAQPDAVPPEPQAQPDAVAPEPQAQPDAVAPEQQALLDWLFERHHTLERVENGGWWRLRTRLQRPLALASRLRAMQAPENRR
jgi:hypothetical protein